MFGRHYEGRGRTTPILKCLNYYKKTDECFFHNSFGIEQAMVQNIVENFVEHAGLPKRAWHGHTHFLLRKILQENR